MNYKGCNRVARWAAAASIGALLLLALVFGKGFIGWGPHKDEGPALQPKDYDPATVRVVRKDMSLDGAPCSSCHDGSEPLQGDPKEKGVFH